MSHFLQNIKEIPISLSRMIAFYESEGYHRLTAWADLMRNRNELIFSGMGTSEFTPLFIRHKIRKVCHIIDAGEWLHYGTTFQNEPNGVVLISQSGESFETKMLVERNIIPNGFVVLTNNENSTLAQRAEIRLLLCAGEEKGISTKTYTNTLALLYLMSAILENDRALEIALQQLKLAVDYLLRTSDDQIAKVAEFLQPAPALAFVGRGPAYVSARQCALTFMEGARCLSAAFTGGAFRHGPFESAGSDYDLVIFVPAGKTRNILEALGRDAARLGTKVVFITDTDISEEENSRVIRIMNVPVEESEDLFPILISRTHPLLLYEVAKSKGLKAGYFRYASKITQRE